jgi:hypothetical protein|tara:strand:- start:1140 stop:1331 length:192 start_codon:yes stop_codon:yes gene_type:complete
MSRIAREDKSTISHINYVTDRIHGFGDELYEDLMEREHQKAKEKAQDLMKVLADLINSLTDEI